MPAVPFSERGKGPLGPVPLTAPSERGVMGSGLAVEQGGGIVLLEHKMLNCGPSFQLLVVGSGKS